MFPAKEFHPALFAVVHQTFLKSISSAAFSPQQCITALNQAFSKNNENCMFVTLFYGVLNFKNNSLTYVNAGHNLPFKISADQTTIHTLPFLENPPLDTDSHAVFQEKTIEFQPGETLFLYTDGITEARNNKKEFFGEHRLKEILKNKSVSIEKKGEKVLNSVWSFIGEEKQSDDMAYLLCQYKGSFF